MARSRLQVRWTTAVPTVLAVVLATGWTLRERSFAREHAAHLSSQTVHLDQVRMEPYMDQGNRVGEIGLYWQGETPGCASLVTGRFVIDPGKSPHPPHVHPDEEILVIESGHGEVICDGKTTKAGPGSIMYSLPNVPHGINNTGTEPLTFTFVKWLPRSATK